MAIALEARSVVKQYQVGSGTVTAVDEVSFTLERGEFVALVGPSGSGKTTMLAMLAGLLQPTSGSIAIDGQDLFEMKESARAEFRRRRIGFTFQANNLVPYLTVLENVELLLRLNGQYNAAGKRRAKELLVLLGLEERLNVLPRQLSGGQQQRVAIARSLINQPALMLSGRDAGRSGARAGERRHHGDPRPAHGGVLRPHHPDGGRAFGADRHSQGRSGVSGRSQCGCLSHGHGRGVGLRRDRCGVAYESYSRGQVNGE